MTSIAGLIYKELWHDPKTSEWSKRWSSDIGWLWVKLISFVDDNQTRGVVTVTQALSVATLNHIPSIAVNQLVEARGLDVVAGGYRIHNFLRRDRLSSIRRGAGSRGGKKRSSNLLEQNEQESVQQNVQQVATPFAAVNGEQQSVQQNSGVGVGVVERIFSKWSDDLGRVVRLTPARRKVIAARLKEKYSEDDLGDAAIGWRNDPWPDRPLHNDLTVLFRDGGQVEKFRDFHRGGPPKPALFKPDGTVARARARAQAFENLADTLETADATDATDATDAAQLPEGA